MVLLSVFGCIGADMVSFLICFSIDAFFLTELFHKLNLVANFEFTFSFAACDLLLIMFLLVSVEAFNILLFSEQQDVFRVEIDIVCVTLQCVSLANLFSFVFFIAKTLIVTLAVFVLEGTVLIPCDFKRGNSNVGF